MAKRDYYEVLSVERTADAVMIKKAYRRLAIEYHPDKNPGDTEAEERFKEAAEAYAVLSDERQRERYDRFGHAGLSGGAGGHGGFNPESFADFHDILGDFFGMGDLFGGGGRRQRGRPRGADLRYDLTIDLEQAVQGARVDLRIPRRESCQTCEGSGAGSADGWRTCESCGGRGQVAFQQGFFTIAKTCSSCRGGGKTLVDPCGDCRGEGTIRQEAEVTVAIPAGVDNGVRLRLSEEGEAVGGGMRGDLYVHLTVREHALFSREDQNLRCRARLTISQASLGATLQVPTLEGEQELEVPAGTQTGTEFSLRGLGVPSLRGGRRGDQIVEVVVVTPRKISDEQRELFRQLAELEGEPVDEKGGIFGKVREFFH
jgi:molecular chaperone DnaJ